MSSIFGILHASRRAMDVGQFGVQIANHNIANINTDGYTRQELVLSPIASLLTGVGDVGRGVELEQIRRVTDEFLQAALYNETSQFNEWAAAANVLDRVQILTGVDEDGSLASAITGFFNAFEELSTNVEDDSVRIVVVNAGVTLAERFHALSAGLDGLEDEINSEVARQSERVSTVLADLASLNRQVIVGEASDGTANDVRVRRDQLLTELSQLVKFTTQEDEFGALDIYIAGRQVVHRDSAVEVTVSDGLSTGGRIEPIQVEVDGHYLAANRVGGSLGSLVETREQELASVREALDLLAGTIVDKVNELHEIGFSPGGSGIPFFEGSDAESIEVFQLLRDRPEFVAHSYNNTPGDNSLAMDLAGLRDALIPELGGRSAIGFYSNLVGEVGSLTATAEGMVENKALTTSELLTRLESVAGVSLDEEVANITRYQTMYEAAARVLNTVNEMLDVLIGMGQTR